VDCNDRYIFLENHDDMYATLDPTKINTCFEAVDKKSDDNIRLHCLGGEHAQRSNPQVAISSLG
jgi:hypothetical protein